MGSAASMARQQLQQGAPCCVCWPCMIWLFRLALVLGAWRVLKLKHGLATPAPDWGHSCTGKSCHQCV